MLSSSSSNKDKITNPNAPCQKHTHTHKDRKEKKRKSSRQSKNQCEILGDRYRQQRRQQQSSPKTFTKTSGEAQKHACGNTSQKAKPWKNGSQRREVWGGGGGPKKTTNKYKKQPPLSSILIPTSQQFDNGMFFFFDSESKSQLKSSPKSSPPSSPNKFCECKNPESEEIQRASSHTQRTKQTNKSQWKNQETREIAKINKHVRVRRGGSNMWVSCAPIGCDIDSTNQRPALVHVSWEISRCLSAYLPTYVVIKKNGPNSPDLCNRFSVNSQNIKKRILLLFFLSYLSYSQIWLNVLVDDGGQTHKNVFFQF
jgi:hypothetical protein